VSGPGAEEIEQITGQNTQKYQANYRIIESGMHRSGL
jgi:hypothetical protein